MKRVMAAKKMLCDKRKLVASACLGLAMILGALYARTTTISYLDQQKPEKTSRGLQTTTTTTTTFPTLPAYASMWCDENPVIPLLPYHNCNGSDVVYSLAFISGLTNGLKMLLLSVIKAFEENRCFYVTENNKLTTRDKSRDEMDSFIGRYFEPIGLSPDDPIVTQARDEGRIEYPEWRHVWENLDNRRVAGRNSTLASLGYFEVEGHLLKRLMLPRMWRLGPQVRKTTCTTLASHDLGKEFLAFSVRRGDKINEKFKYQELGDYIKKAEEEIIPQFFDNVVPKIFVASDDCRVLNTFRKMKPDWTFVSECDKLVGKTKGFELSKMKTWTLEETDRHFAKFFVELYALATAKYYIGVAYTNVAWWVYFMRENLWSMKLLDRPHSQEDTLNYW